MTGEALQPLPFAGEMLATARFTECPRAAAQSVFVQRVQRVHRRFDQLQRPSAAAETADDIVRGAKAEAAAMHAAQRQARET